MLTVLLSQITDRAGIPVLHAPLVAGDWDRDGGVDLESWHAVVAGRLHNFDIPVTLREGTAEGKLYGGACRCSLPQWHPYEPQPKVFCFSSRI